MEDFITKTDKRNKIKNKLKNKQVKHWFWDNWWVVKKNISKEMKSFLKKKQNKKT